ncbi:hypothetical protein PT974_01277 [Cladobotryum mycophilum]|uniref:2-dehydropantoate 2-reductase n=1 Tax=Cladobotryum mycophilum TaxID=491253 RepID=A0ABR0T375_9HYPO
MMQKLDVFPASQSYRGGANWLFPDSFLRQTSNHQIPTAKPDHPCDFEIHQKKKPPFLLPRPNAHTRWVTCQEIKFSPGDLYQYPLAPKCPAARPFKVAGPTRLRFSARLCQRRPQWARDSVCVGRVAGRAYGTVASTPDRQHDSSPHETLSSEANDTPPPPPPTRRPWSAALQSEPIAAKSRPSPQFYVPSVLLPPEAAKSPAVHKIHILGDDERSRFIAHALSGVYDSVERLGWRSTTTSKYRNIQKVQPSNEHGAPIIEVFAVTPRILAQDDDSHIDQLIVTGHGYEAAEALESVKHRVDGNTAICLMNDGLGVLEDVREKIFSGTDASSPTFFLGHMSHRLALNRAYDSVKELRHGVTKLTMMDMSRFRDKDKVESRMSFVRTLQEVKDLNSSLTPFDQWLRFKLPSVIFDSVVEPVCVLLEMPYEGVLQNPAAQRMLFRLLDEIILVVDNMPELEGSSAIRDYIRGNGVRKHMYNQILSKRSHPSELARRIQYGLPTDVEYLNGFFLRQARLLGLHLPANHMMKDMIKAKHSLAVEKLNSFVPMEETSIPSESQFRYRTMRR